MASRQPHSRRPLPARVGDRELEAEALNLKLGGMGYRQIAQAQGCSVSTAHDRVTRALDGMVPADEADALRKIENERLNVVVQACLEVIGRTRTIREPDPADPEKTVLVEVPAYSADERLAATGRLTKVSERIAKLNGLDIPVVQKVEVSKVDNLDTEIERLMAELGQAR